MSYPAARVRPFDPKTDLFRVIAFHCDLIETNFPTKGLVDGQEYDRALKEEAFSPEGYFKRSIITANPHTNGLFVWEEGTRLVGYIWLSLRRDEFLNADIGIIREIYVIPDRRGMGLGKNMMAFADDWFLVHGVKVQRLDVTADNVQAVELYKKCGFEIYRFEMERVVTNAGNNKRENNSP